MFYSVIYPVIKQTLNSAFDSFRSVSTLNHPFQSKYFLPYSAFLFLTLKRGFSCWEPEVGWL